MMIDDKLHSTDEHSTIYLFFSNFNKNHPLILSFVKHELKGVLKYKGRNLRVRMQRIRKKSLCGSVVESIILRKILVTKQYRAKPSNLARFDLNNSLIYYVRL
jgi:hypothetical protein